MTAYWLLLLIPALCCLYRPNSTWVAWECWLIGIILTLFIGLRHEVGGDWYNYLPYLTNVEGVSLQEVVSLPDPGYNIVNWFFASYPNGIYGVNLVCGAIFSFGLVLFCRIQPRPWLALCLAIPYLVIVVAIGYSRQGVAIGLIMPGLLALERGRYKTFLSSVLVASTFHFSALITLGLLLPILPGRSISIRFLRLLLVLVIGVAMAQAFIASRLEFLIGGYIEAELQSEGATIRLAMNVVPTALLLVWPNRFSLANRQLVIWRTMSIAAVFCIVALLMLPSMSTLLDRIALYLIPLQLVVLGRLPGAKLFGIPPKYMLPGVLIYSIVVEFIWLNFGKHAESWLPYKNVLLY